MVATTEPPPSQRGVAEVSQILFDSVTRYHAAIGPGVNSSELAKLESKLLEEGRQACYKQLWDEALNLFTHALAVTEKAKTEMSADTGNRATLVHNIAFCLHALGEFDAAKAYYEQSLEGFKNVNVPFSTKVLQGLLYPERLICEAIYGGLNHNRIQMTKERIFDCEFKRLPDLTQLDGWGRRRPLPNQSPDSNNNGEQQQPWRLWGNTSGGPSYEKAAISGGEEGPADAPPPPQEETRAPRWLAAVPTPQTVEKPSVGRQAAVAAAAASRPKAAESSKKAEEEEEEAEQEAARKEWLAYYMEISDWEKAGELVVTREEQEDLDYLQDRARRDAERRQ